MKKRILIFIISVILILSGCGTVTKSAAASPDINDYIKLDSDTSFLDDFSVDSDKVYIKCELTVQNNLSKDVKVKIYASSEEDVEIGLLIQADMKGYAADLITDTFTLSKGENHLVVRFVGDFAGTDMKTDRNLPEVSFEAVQAE